MPVSIGIHRVQRRVEARRHQQVLEVRVAAVDEEAYHDLVGPDGLHAAGGSRGKRRVASMAYEPPQTLRTQRADISAFVSVPLQSTSMRSKHFRAAFKNSLLNSSISLAARAASSSRLAARSASLFLRASSIAASLRGTPTGEPRETRRRSRGRGDGVLLRHQHAIAAAPASKAPQIIELRSAPLDHVDVPVPIGVEHGERRLEARRDQQVLEVFIAAVDEEFYHFLVILHGVDNFRLLQVARLVDVDL